MAKSIGDPKQEKCEKVVCEHNALVFVFSWKVCDGNIFYIFIVKREGCLGKSYNTIIII